MAEGVARGQRVDVRPRLFRVVVPVGEVDRAAAFYAQLLGFAGERVAPARHDFDCGGTILACVDPRADDGGLRPNAGCVYFAVEDVAAAYDRARAAGARITDRVRRRASGERSFYCRDPWDNPLCFADEATVFSGGRSVP